MLFRNRIWNRYLKCCTCFFLLLGSTKENDQCLVFLIFYTWHDDWTKTTDLFNIHMCKKESELKSVQLFQE